MALSTYIEAITTGLAEEMRRHADLSYHSAHLLRRRRGRRLVSLANQYHLVHPRARAGSRCAFYSLRRQGIAEVGHSRRQSGDLFRAQKTLSLNKRRVAGGG